MKAKILFLKSGESVPSWKPKRYTNGQRYVKLRWRLGKGLYCEVWEHRVRDGKVINGINHHKNRNKHDNSPENLLECSDDREHAKEHRRYDYEQIALLYQQGISIPRLAQMFQAHDGTITHILHKQNVTMRFGKGKPGNRRITVDEALIIRKFEECSNVSWVSRTTGISRHIVERVIFERIGRDSVRLGFRAPDNLFGRPSKVITK